MAAACAATSQFRDALGGVLKKCDVDHNADTPNCAKLFLKAGDDFGESYVFIPDCGKPSDCLAADGRRRTGRVGPRIFRPTRRGREGLSRTGRARVQRPIGADWL